MPTEPRNRTAMPKGDLSNVRTVQQYAAQAIGRAELSRAASEAAIEKATRPDVRELAGYVNNGGLDKGAVVDRVWQAAEAHGGTVEVESAPTLGTRVTVLLPAAHGSVP